MPLANSARMYKKPFLLKCHGPSGWRWPLLGWVCTKERKKQAGVTTCVAQSQLVLNLNLPLAANSGLALWFLIICLNCLNFIATILCYLIRCNWIMTKAVKSHIAGFMTTFCLTERLLRLRQCSMYVYVCPAKCTYSVHSLTTFHAESFGVLLHIIKLERPHKTICRY